MGNATHDHTIDLLDLYKKRICPLCGKHIPKGEGVGSGRKADGIFCNLDCYTQFYASHFIEKNFTKQVDMDKNHD